MWIFYALLSALFAAWTAVFAKVGVSQMNSNLATAIRTVIVLFMIWTIVLVKGELKEIGNISKQNILFLILSGIGTGLSWIFYFKALQLGNVSQVVAIDKLSVAITIILSIMFLKEALTVKTAIGAGLIILGTLVLTME